MQAEVSADFAKDIKNHLTELLHKNGYSIDENKPQSLAGITGDHLRRRSAWNIAFQFYNVLKRGIEPLPRKVIWSSELSGRALSREFKAAIELIIAECEAGRSLTRFMSTGMQDATYDDVLTNDWGIVHFHLGETIPVKESLKTKLAVFVNRTGPLLFAYPTNTHLYLIDILPHGPWSELNMIEIIHEQWPDILSRYKLPLARATVIPDQQMIKDLRQAGACYPLVMSDGTDYLQPGGGYTTTQSSAVAMDRTNILFNQIKPLEDYFCNNADAVIQNINNQRNTSITRLELSLHYYPELGEWLVIEMQTKSSLWQARI